MNAVTVVRRSMLVCLVSMVFGGVACLPADAAPPNVVLIMTDDQGYGDMSLHGNKDLETPRLDQLFREGIELTQFYVCANCSPTRASLLTGRYNYRTGVTEVVRGRHLMHADEVTIAERLKAAGYQTGIFGKWHLGSNYPMRPTDQGFDVALVHKGGGIGQAAGPPGNTYFDPVLEENDTTKTFEGYCNDIFTDAAMEFVEQHREQPFFVYLASNLPHLPLQIGDEYADPYRKRGLHESNAKVYGMMANIDYNVGRMLDKLEALGLAGNTIVIFLSDNGPRHRRTKNDAMPGRYVAGLRGTKTSVYENGIRVPFCIRWPDQLTGGRRLESLAAHIDVLPTLMAACGVETPSQNPIDGVNLLPRLRGDVASLPSRNLYFQWHNGEVPFRYLHFAVRSSQYKLVAPMDDPHSVMAPPSREEINRIVDALELYDIRQDPSETKNIARKNPTVVAQMLDDYEQWFSNVTAERDFGVGQRIHLGARQQDPVVLSQFEWRGPGSQSGYGYWQVRVERSGSYRVRLRFPTADEGTQAHINFGALHLSAALQSGAREYTFAEVPLVAGVGKFEAYLKNGRSVDGAEFVDVWWDQ